MRVVGMAAMVLSLAACGTTIRPHVTQGGTGRPNGGLPGGGLNPRLGPDVGAADEPRPVIDEVCRANGMRSGWIAIRYLQRGENCPASTDPENQYTAAIIERYDLKPIGATMIVCADQPLPRDWARASNQDVQATCEGARVKEGSPTVMVIRRVSGREGAE